MTNEVFKDYIEKKKADFRRITERFCETEIIGSKPCFLVSIEEGEQFLSDMAQEIFRQLPKEKDLLNPDTVLWRERAEGHNSCRSTFLENIKKLK